MSLRVLVVDDSGVWRRYVASTLAKSGRYEVAGELADGLGAVEAVERLTPDLTLLDVGLPSRSGIEVAAQIFAAAPKAKILFLSKRPIPRDRGSRIGDRRSGVRGQVRRRS